MIALSVRQPWAFAILYLGKTVENRTWHLRRSGLRPPFDCLIHAGKAWGRDEKGDAEDMRLGGLDVPDVLPLGAILGIVTITGCITSARDEAEAKWFNGPYAFTIANPRPLPEPVSWKGALGFFHVPDEAVFADDALADA